MLILCPTPIGNLSDVTPRQREALSTADVIACEDTRTTGKLLELLGISRVDGVPRLVSYHEHSEAERASELVDRLLEGAQVVLVSDAGTPAISDPGFLLVSRARAAGVDVTVLPGPVAAVLAVAGSGLPTDRWCFGGFLPTRSSARLTRLEEARGSGVTVTFYESPHRVLELLSELEDVFGGDHPVCVARELTKLHEEWLHGTVADVRGELDGRDRVRGEFVVVVGAVRGDDGVEEHDVDPWLAAMIDAGLKPSTIKSIAAQVSGLSKSEVFDRMERLKS